MDEEKCQNDATCEACNQTSSCSEQEKESHVHEERLKSNLSRIKRRVLVMSGKGGVGKSTVSANLAVALSMDGFNIGLLDALKENNSPITSTNRR